jgi:hypothetical protein
MGDAEKRGRDADREIAQRPHSIMSSVFKLMMRPRGAHLLMGRWRTSNVGAEFRLERVQASAILGENVGGGACKESRNRFASSPISFDHAGDWLVLGRHGTTSFCSSFE